MNAAHYQIFPVGKNQLFSARQLKLQVPYKVNL